MQFARLDLSDRLELQELIARYSFARDERDLETLVGYFTTEAEFERAGRVVRGREAIKSFFQASMDRYDVTNHVTHTQVLDPVDAGVVVGRVAGHAELVLEGSLVVAAYRYTDRYQKVDDTWLIDRRHLQFLYAMPVEDLSTGFIDNKRIRWPGQEPQIADYPESSPTWNTYHN